MSRSPRHVENLSNYELFNELKKCGFSPGPVVQTTRNLYIKKLIQLWDSGCTDQLPVENRNKPSFEEEEADFTYVTKQKTVMEEDRKVRDFEVSPGSLHTKNISHERKMPLLSNIQRIPTGNEIHRDIVIGNEQRRYSSDYMNNIKRRAGMEQRQRPAMNPVGRKEPLALFTWKKLVTLILVFLIFVYFIVYILQEWKRTDPYEALEEEAREVLRKLEGREEQ